MNIRKCSHNEMDKIIKVADSCFKDIRDTNFTFKNSKPFIYDNKNKDYSTIHYVIENDNNDIVSLGANLINNIKVSNTNYNISRVGTIGTLPNYRNQGHMKRIFTEIDKENKENNIVFSILQGKKNRYENFGYAKAGFVHTYVFDKTQNKYLKNLYNIEFKSYSNNNLDTLYSIYSDTQDFILRSKDNFIIHVNNTNNTLYEIYNENNIIGYFSINGSHIDELCLINNKYIDSVILQLLNSNDIIQYDVNNHNDTVIYITIPSTNKELSELLSQLSDFKNISESYNIKVYKLEEFIQFLLQINNLVSINKKEIYKIGNVIKEFKFKNNTVTTKICNKRYLYEFENENEFIRYILGNKVIYPSVSTLFPLSFSLNQLDKF